MLMIKTGLKINLHLSSIYPLKLKMYTRMETLISRLCFMTVCDIAAKMSSHDTWNETQLYVTKDSLEKTD